MNANFVSQRKAELAEEIAARESALRVLDQAYTDAADGIQGATDTELVAQIVGITGSPKDESRTRPLLDLLNGGYVDHPVPKVTSTDRTSEATQLTRDAAYARHSAFMHELWRRALPRIDENFGLGLIPKGEQQD